jgi:hypothetical protein
MRVFNRVSHRVEFPRDTKITLKPIIDRLLADNDDGDCFQSTIRPYFASDRPLVRIERGETTCLYVEGPTYTVGGKSFPLGAQLLTEVGWLDLTPMQAAHLVGMIERAIDAVAFRWIVEERQLNKTHAARRNRNRAVDDPLALRQMVAAVSETPLEAGADHA